MNPKLFNIDTALISSRTVVRRFREGDGESFYKLVQGNTMYLEDHFPFLVEQVNSADAGEAFIRRKLAEWLLQESFSFGIWRREEADLVGYIHLFELDWSVPRAEVSYFLDQEQAGKGLMTEVLARIVQFSFRQLRLNKLALRTLVDNYPSQRLARKVGFRREGDLRGEFAKPSGALFDLMLFGLTREEYGE
ncbi:MAG: GNAT family N-acetyltransferase [Lewinella sp.]|nr:GNAT family N-acetyltransferase [Lewinella sp.]